MIADSRCPRNWYLELFYNFFKITLSIQGLKYTHIEKFQKKLFEN